MLPNWSLFASWMVFISTLTPPGGLSTILPACYFSCLYIYAKAQNHNPKSQRVVNSVYCTSWVFLTELIWFLVTLWCLCSSVSLNAKVGADHTAVQHMKIHTASIHTYTKQTNTLSSHIVWMNNIQHLWPQGVVITVLHLVCVHMHVYITLNHSWCQFANQVLRVTFEPPNEVPWGQRVVCNVFACSHFISQNLRCL